MYKCMLFRIQGPALYDKLKAEEVLPLPCVSTIQNYYKGLKAEYGFQDTLFDSLKLKAQGITSRAKKRGIF